MTVRSFRGADCADDDHVRPLRWTGMALDKLDARRLRFYINCVRCLTVDTMSEAIQTLSVRGAPAIGIAAGWGASWQPG